jgi:hypothetical protein
MIICIICSYMSCKRSINPTTKPKSRVWSLTRDNINTVVIYAARNTTKVEQRSKVKSTTGNAPENM